MATVTQVASASISSGTTLSFTNINAVYGDWLIWTTAAYSFFTGSTLAYPGLAKSVTNSPTMYVYGTVWQVTTPLVNATVTYYQSASAPATGQMYRLQPDPGNELILREASIASFIGSSSPSISTYGTMTVGSLVMAFGGVADDTKFTDTDTTDGVWSPVWQTISNASTDIATFSQYKITTGTATQTWGGTWATGTSENAALSWWVFYEVGRPYVGMRATT